MLEVKYEGKEVKINVDLLIFMEKNAGSGKSGKKDFQEMIGSQTRVFITKHKEDVKGLREEVMICFLVLEAYYEKENNRRKRNGEIKDLIMEEINAYAFEKKLEG